MRRPVCDYLEEFPAPRLICLEIVGCTDHGGVVDYLRGVSDLIEVDVDAGIPTSKHDQDVVRTADDCFDERPSLIAGLAPEFTG